MLIQSTRSRNPIRAGALRFPPGSISKMKFFFGFVFKAVALDLNFFGRQETNEKKKRLFGVALSFLFLFPPVD